MLTTAEMLKVPMYLLGAHTTVPTKDGRFSTLLKLRMKLNQDLTKNLALISTDHSTSDQECQWEESWNLLVLAMLL
jgi:hypothetical protein